MTTLVFALSCFMLLVLLCIGYWYVDKWHARILCQAKEYERKYNTIANCIDCMPVNSQNYDTILRMLASLGQLKYKNKEKTVVLTNKFWIRFQSERIIRLSEDEFSIENSLS